MWRKGRFLSISITLKSQNSDRSELSRIPPAEGLDVVDAAAVGVVVARGVVLDLSHVGTDVVSCEGGHANVNLEENVGKFLIGCLDVLGVSTDQFWRL